MQVKFEVFQDQDTEVLLGRRINPAVFNDYNVGRVLDKVYAIETILKITHGHSKEHRPDLMQFLISMLCVDRNVPVFGKTEDGNSSDKTINFIPLGRTSKWR